MRRRAVCCGGFGVRGEAVRGTDGVPVRHPPFSIDCLCEEEEIHHENCPHRIMVCGACHCEMTQFEVLSHDCGSSLAVNFVSCGVVVEDDGICMCTRRMAYLRQQAERTARRAGRKARRRKRRAERVVIAVSCGCRASLAWLRCGGR